MREFFSLVLYLLVQYGCFFLFLGFPAFLAVRWCLRRNHWLLRGLTAAAAAACVLGCVFGVLRLTGMVILPGDHTYSTNFFDATWRDHGAALLLTCGGFLISIAAAWNSVWRAGGEKSPPPPV